MAILPQIIGSLSAALARAALAQDCLLCALPSGNSPLCTACAADLPRLPGACCPRCALPTPAGALCGRCLAHPPHYDRTIAAYRYDFPLDKLIMLSNTGIVWRLPLFLVNRWRRLQAT